MGGCGAEYPLGMQQQVGLLGAGLVVLHCCLPRLSVMAKAGPTSSAAANAVVMEDSAVKRLRFGRRAAIQRAATQSAALPTAGQQYKEQCCDNGVHALRAWWR